MQDSEFIKWFQGFTDAISECPSPKQWQVIKERLSMQANKQKSGSVFERYAPATASAGIMLCSTAKVNPAEPFEPYTKATR